MGAGSSGGLAVCGQVRRWSGHHNHAPNASASEEMAPPHHGRERLGSGGGGSTSSASRSRSAAPLVAGTWARKQTPRHRSSSSTTDAQEKKKARTSKWDVMHKSDEHFEQRLARRISCPPKKRREVYCGNLGHGQIPLENLTDGLSNLFKALPAFAAAYPDLVDIIRSVFAPGGSKYHYAFVEFPDEVLANTAVHMSGFELNGHRIPVGRPQGYLQPDGGELPPLNVQPLRDMGLLPNVPETVSFSCPGSIAEKKLRELYFGNLKVDGVTEAMITELITPAAAQLKDYCPGLGPPITQVSMSSTYCFVLLQSAEMATRLINVFNGVELLGRPLRVARPAGCKSEDQRTETVAGLSEAFAAGAAAASQLQFTL